MRTTRNYAVQAANVAAAVRLQQLFDPNVILPERQGRNCGGPSGAVHREVSLRPVLTRLCLHTGDEWEFRFTGDNGHESIEYHQSLADLGNRDMGLTFLFTVTEEEYVQ